MKKKNLLIDEYPLLVLPSLAVQIGLNEAIALQQIHYWLGNPKGGVEIDGERWVYNTYEEWQLDNFPFWSVRTVQRVFNSLEEMGLVISMQQAAYDRKKYYRVHYDKLASWNTSDCLNAEFQNGVIDDDNMASSSLTETTPETTHKPLDAQKIHNAMEAADKTMDIILAGERAFVEEKMKGKTWKHRTAFATSEIMVLLADLCVLKFGEPTKKDIPLWMAEIQGWVAHGVLPRDWKRMLEIIAEYTTPAMGITGVSKAIKFAATERREKKEGVTYVRPEHKPIQAKTGNFVPPPANLGKPGSVPG